MQKYSIGNNPHRPFCFQFGMVYRELSCKEVAELARVDLKTAQRWANGTQKPSPAAAELLFLKVTGRILPDNRIWHTSYINDAGRLALPDGRDWIPTEIYASDYQRAMLYDAQRETERAKDKLNAVISSIHLPSF